MSSPAVSNDLGSPNFEPVGCIQCDLAAAIDQLTPGERADCPRCGHFLTSYVADGFARSLALATSSLLLLAMANAFPFLSLQASGLEKVMTLPRTAIEDNPYLVGALTPTGGHVGFVSGPPWRRQYWAESYGAAFLQRHLAAAHAAVSSSVA